jgi:hypothetical protein
VRFKCLPHSLTRSYAGTGPSEVKSVVEQFRGYQDGDGDEGPKVVTMKMQLSPMSSVQGRSTRL